MPCVFTLHVVKCVKMYYDLCTTYKLDDNIELSSSSVFCEDCVYKEVLVHTSGEILYCAEDDDDEVKQHNKYSVGVFCEEKG